MVTAKAWIKLLADERLTVKRDIDSIKKIKNSEKNKYLEHRTVTASLSRDSINRKLCITSIGDGIDQVRNRFKIECTIDRKRPVFNHLYRFVHSV